MTVLGAHHRKLAACGVVLAAQAPRLAPLPEAEHEGAGSDEEAADDGAVDQPPKRRAV